MENPLSWFLRTASEAQKNAIKLGDQQFRDDTKTKSNKRLINDKLPPVANHTDMKIISPFYDRTKCTGVLTCKCPYHKRMREQAPARHLLKKKCIVSTQLSPSQREKTAEKIIKEPRRSCKPQFLTKKGKENMANEDSKQSKRVGFEEENKIDHSNEQFEKFLQSHTQWLLKKYKYLEKDPHIIKNSVQQIFHFIYKNLKQPRDFVKSHIDTLVKDRDITNYYMERYDQLRAKLFQRKEDRKFKTSVNNRSLENLQKIMSKKLLTQYKPKRTSFMTDSRGMSRKKTQKLVIQMMIDDIENGYEVDERHLKKLEEEPVEILIENCDFLKKVIGKLDEDTLIEVRDNILLKLQDKLKSYDPFSQTTPSQIIQPNQNQFNQSLSLQQLKQRKDITIQELLTKRDQIENVISLINSKLEDLNQDSEHNDKMSIRSRNSNRSNISIKKSNYSFKRESNFRRETGYLKSNFKSSDLPNSLLNEDISEEDSSEKEIKEEKQEDREKGKSEQKKLEEASKGPLQLAKYRRLSHDGFFHHKFDDSDFQPQMPKISIKNVEEIESELDAMEGQFKQRFKTLKEIETHIAKHHLQDLIISEDDCLLTAKRKARAFKKVMKEQGLTPEMKFYIKEYLNLIEQQNFIKNRKWAHNKFKNMLLGQNNVELFGDPDTQEEDLKQYIKNALRDIFGLKSKLIFYDIIEASYLEGQVDFQENLFSFIQARNQKEEQKKTVFQKQKTIVQRREEKKTAALSKKEDILMQVGLNNIVHSSYFGIELGQDPEEDTKDDFDLMSKKREESYIRLFQKLQQLGS